LIIKKSVSLSLTQGIRVGEISVQLPPPSIVFHKPEELPSVAIAQPTEELAK
jgi:hypothetical protein